MNHEEIIQIFRATGIPYKQGRAQKQWHQVRFFGLGTGHSLNLGYSIPEGYFVADFVFKAFASEVNIGQCTAFSTLYGGEARVSKTAFCRVLILDP
jgi:hypothetical protein